MADYQFVEQYDWIPAFGITYHIGIDGISLFLVLLTTILITLSILYSGGGDIEERPREFCFFMLVLETGLLGTLLSVDLFLFYMFWEVMLIPMYFLIGHLGTRAQDLRRDQVRIVHDGRIVSDAGRDPVPRVPGARAFQPHQLRFAAALPGAADC